MTLSIKVKKSLVGFLGIFLLLNSSFMKAQSPQSVPALTESEKKGIVGRDLIFHRKYAEALDYFKKIAAEEPRSPLGTFGQMAIWQARMFENYDFKFDQEFETASEENKKVVDQILSQNNNSAWDLFLAGSASGIRGFYLMRKGSTLKALSEANTAKKLLSQALEKDPGFADIYVGLGMYDYWRSVFTSRIKILPFFADRRAEGLSQIEKAIQEGRVAGALSEVALAFCYYQAGNSQKGIPPLERILKDYPENVIAKNLLGDFYAMRGNYLQAHQIFGDLIQNNPEIGVSRFFEAKTYLRENKLVEARKWYEEYLKTNPVPQWTSYALTDLGFIDLREGKEKEAYEKFKKASRTYPEDPVPLHELQKLRGKRF